MSKCVSVGGGQGFWGDSPDAAIHMMRHADLQYLACDYLAELTMSIMAKQKRKNPNAGFATDFIHLLDEIMTDGKDRNIKIISNAGGMNILGAVEEIEKLAKNKNLEGYKIGYVLGDDILDQIEELRRSGVAFDNIDGQGDFDMISDKIINANVYFGHEPIVECLEQGADVVITGRSADSAMFLAPFVYEFNWEKDDWDNLARGIIAGHLLECGGQATGGNFQYDWRSVPRMDELGFPIVEMTSDTLHITKAPDCGGLVSEQTCKEQLLYEIHDPANYVTPDVVVDLSQVTVTQDGKDRVRVDNIHGKSKPDTLKLSIGYHAGYKVVTYLCFSWPDAYEKAQYAAEIIMKKMKRKGLRAEDIHISYLGLNSLHLGVANMDPNLVKELNEVVLRIAIRTEDKAEAQKLVPEIAPLQLNGPPGACFFGGRSKVQEVIGLWPTLIPRDAVKLTTQIREVK